MASSAVLNRSILNIQPRVKPNYHPTTLEAQRALSVVLGANTRQHLCCYEHESQVAEIGYWQRGLKGRSYFVSLGSGTTLDEAVIAAARKITQPLALVEKPNAAELQMRELVDLCAATVCPLCAGQRPTQVKELIEMKPRLRSARPEIPVYVHFYEHSQQAARTCVATLLRSQADLFIASLATRE